MGAVLRSLRHELEVPAHLALQFVRFLKPSIGDVLQMEAEVTSGTIQIGVQAFQLLQDALSKDKHLHLCEETAAFLTLQRLQYGGRLLTEGADDIIDLGALIS